MQYTTLFALLLVLVQLVAAQTPNPQQQVCARPPKGCPTQVKYQSCVNWQGCKWTSTEMAGPYCVNDDSCATKPTKVPTNPPVPPTPAPTNKPVPPTSAPVAPCQMPSNGCKKIKSKHACGNWSGCEWKDANSKCKELKSCKTL